MANKEVMTLWADALESDEYKQGNGLLKQQVGDKCFHCCLGVLCELYLKSHPETEATFKLEGQDQAGKRVFKFVSPNLLALEGYTAYLPHEVRDWAGFQNENPRVATEKYGYVAMVYLNDTVKLKFKEIAEIVRGIPA
jgi:hypothetical protein